MPNFIIKKVAVLGAGVMGAQIAAHCVNARVPVVLFDLPAREGPKNGIVLRAIENLYKKVSAFIAPHAIFATNTSGLSITALSEGFDADLKARFCGVHFFNPPRYMHLVEIIPTASTRPEISDQLEGFLTTTLGKGVVRAI